MSNEIPYFLQINFLPFLFWYEQLHELCVMSIFWNLSYESFLFQIGLDLNKNKKVAPKTIKPETEYLFCVYSIEVFIYRCENRKRHTVTDHCHGGVSLLQSCRVETNMILVFEDIL